MKNRHRHQNPQIPHNNHHPGRAGTFWGVLNVLICAFGPHLSWDWILLLMGGCTFGGYVSGGHTALFIFIQHLGLLIVQSRRFVSVIEKADDGTQFSTYIFTNISPE